MDKWLKHMKKYSLFLAIKEEEHKLQQTLAKMLGKKDPSYTAFGNVS
jgi:hypothetical protein